MEDLGLGPLALGRIPTIWYPSGQGQLPNKVVIRYMSKEPLTPYFEKSARMLGVATGHFLSLFEDYVRRHFDGLRRNAYDE